MLSALLAAAEETGETPNPLLPAVYDIIWSAVCFAIILIFFVWKFLPAIKKTLDARAEAIEGGIKKAEIAQAEAAAALAQYQDQLAEGRAEAAKIREQARADGGKIIAELKEQATIEAARIAAAAQAQIEAERQAAVTSLRAEVGTLAIDLASGVIGQSLSDDKKASALVEPVPGRPGDRREEQGTVMGSATREALAAARRALASVSSKDGLATATQLFEAGRVIGHSAQLRAALADPSAAAADKKAVIGSIFSSLGASAKSLLSEIASTRWSTQDDLLAGIEEIGIRAAAASAPGAPIEAELFTFGAAVSSDAELELAVGSKLGTPAAKSALVSALLSGKATPQTVAIVDHLVQQPRGRRIGELIRTAAAIVADEANLSVATVVSATPLDDKQLERLRVGLSKQHGRDLRINQVIDPTIIGGLRVQIGDDVIDGSVSTRLTDLRLRLAS